MNEMVSQTTRIYHVEHLCRVVLAISQGKVTPELPPALATLADVPRLANQRHAEADLKVTEGLFTSAIAEGRIASWLFNPEEHVNY